MRSLLLGGLLAVGAPALATAQVGTQVWVMQMDIPDSMASKTAGLTEVEIKMTFASNGTQYAMQMEPGQAMVAAFPMMDLSAVRLVAVLPVQGDSFHIGVVLPPTLAAQLGGSIGYRVDGVIPDSIPMPASFDSLIALQSEVEQPDMNWANTGRTSTAGGLPCEEWTATVDPQSDDVEGPITINFCLAPQGGLMAAWTGWMKQRFPQLMSNYDKMREAGLAQFGGRDLVPLRMEITSPMPMKMELVSQTNTVPDASFFLLPVGLEPFPLEMFGGMMPAQPGN
jgi:hypothetical protein